MKEKIKTKRASHKKLADAYEYRMWKDKNKLEEINMCGYCAKSVNPKNDGIVVEQNKNEEKVR